MGFTRSDDGTGMWHYSYWVTGGLTGVFGVAPQLGRDLQGDARADDPGLLINGQLWRERYGAEPGTVGTDVRYHDRDRQIVGVLAEEFEIYTNAIPPYARRPAVLENVPNNWWITDYGVRRYERWIRVFGRLAPRRQHRAAQQRARRSGRTLARRP